MKIVLVGKSGVGKTTLERIIKERQLLPASVSTTTRPPREGEIDGIHYHFVSRHDFEGKIANGELAEYAVFKGNYYGSEIQHLPADCVIVVEPIGAGLLKSNCPDCITVKLVASEETRQQRLNNRTEASTDEDEVRFDSFVGDYELDANKSPEEVFCEFYAIYLKLKGSA